MLEESQDILNKIKKVRYLLNGKTPNGEKATYGPPFTSLRYSIVLLASTMLSIFKEDILDSSLENCVKYNLYGLNKTAESLNLEFDRTRTAKRIYEELRAKGDVDLKRNDSHEYLCMTKKGREKCLKKIDELILLDNYFIQNQSLSTVYVEGNRFISKGFKADPVQAQKIKEVENLISRISDTYLIQNSKALVIGISKYDNLQPLEFCANDGKDMYSTLKSLGYEISENNGLIGYIPWTKMRDSIYDFFTDKNIKPEDTLLFYYSGHGVPDEDGEVYFSTSEIDPDLPNRRGVGFGELTRMMQKCISTKIVCILDCCYSGSAKISKGHDDDAAKIGMAALDRESRSISTGEGRCILAASQALQEAYGLEESSHSIFTHYLLEGLKGNSKDAIDANDNVTVDSLSKYIYNTIMSLPVEKRPKQKPIKKVEASGEIILAYYGSEKNIQTEEILKKDLSLQSRNNNINSHDNYQPKKSIEEQIRAYCNEARQKGKPISILECSKRLKIPYTKVRTILSEYDLG